MNDDVSARPRRKRSWWRRARRAAARRLVSGFGRFFGVLAVRLLVGSCRTRVVGWDTHVEAEHAAGRAVLFAFWHNRLLVPTWVFRKRDIHVLVSRHGDGALIANILDRLGFVTVRGSAERSQEKRRKGGMQALHRMAKQGRAGYDLAFTPDGPGGPVYSIAPGFLALARLTRLPVVIMGVECERYWRLRSWDSFRVPKPFTRVACCFGPPMELPRDEAAAHAMLDTELRRVSEVAARMVGVEDPFPDAGDTPVGMLRESTREA